MARDKQHDNIEEDGVQQDGSGEDHDEMTGMAEEDLVSEGPDEEMNELDRLRQELESLGLKASENLELALRAQAELDNIRKRTARDIENAHKYALEKFVTDLVPVMDSLELGIQASVSAGDVAGLREGMDLTLKKFNDTLERFGVAVVNPQGQKFNPDKHDAVSMTEVEGTEPGMVISVLQKGYELNGRLVRPAMVVVSR